MKVNAGNLKKGDFIEYQGEIYQVQKTEFYSPGKGSALMKTKIRGIVSGKGIDYTFKSNEIVETLSVNSVEMQYLYKDAESLYFMDERTCNQFALPLSSAGRLANFLKEGEKCYVYLYKDEPLALRFPLSVKLKVIETDEAVKGDTVSGATKPAIVETGAVINVPLFIKPGDVIAVNPETGNYTERISQS